MAREALEEIAHGDYCWKSRKPSDEPWAIHAPVSNMHKPRYRRPLDGNKQTGKRLSFCAMLASADCSSCFHLSACGG